MVLTASQILKATVTLKAKASPPNKDGPGGFVFPELAAGLVAGLTQAWFRVALVCQVVISVGLFLFLWMEQMSKP
jgi:alpha-1,3-glucan synthase